MDFSIVQLSQNLKEEFEDLKKALKPDQWASIQKAHSPESAEIIDFTPYLAEHVNSHPHYKNMLGDPKEHAAVHPKEFMGAEKKLVHKNVREDIPSVSAGFGTYMIKPAATKLKSNLSHHQQHPITGWATLAAHGLFHAAGMGENVEDVSAHQIDGVPITVHRFAPGAQTLGNMSLLESSHAINHPETFKKLVQGAVLDFLMGSTDRHYNNMVFVPSKDDTRRSDPVYIDNGLNFNYKNTGLGGWRGKAPDKISNHTAITTRYAINHPNSVEHLTREWWEDHKDAIKNEMYKHLQRIKDPRIRNHIEQNFMARFDHVDGNLGGGMFDENYGKGIPLIPMQRKPRVSQKQLLSSLPADPLQALDVLNRAGKGKNSDIRQKLQEAAFGLIPKMTPKQMLSAYLTYHNTNLSGLSYEILKHIHEANNEPAKKFFLDWHKNAMIQRGEDPEKPQYVWGVGLSPYWHEKFVGEKK
jgi:hypothetical protein